MEKMQVPGSPGMPGVVSVLGVGNAPGEVGAFRAELAEATADESRLVFRPAVSSDRSNLEDMLVRTGAFRHDEVAVALELFDAATGPVPSPDYTMWMATISGQMVGYVCYGPTPMTQGTYDLYWIAVDSRFQGKGFGSAIMAFAEEQIRSLGGRLIVVETSSQSGYAAPRRLYEKCGYALEARLKDYYSPGDDLLIFIKRL